MDLLSAEEGGHFLRARGACRPAYAGLPVQNALTVDSFWHGDILFKHCSTCFNFFVACLVSLISQLECGLVMGKQGDGLG